MGSATASGQSRAQEAIMKALDSPLLNDNKITGAKNVLLLIVSGTDEITLDEIGEINDHIQNEAGYSANIIMGVGEDQSLEDSIAVTIIATGFNLDQQNEISNTETKKVVHTLSEEPVKTTTVQSTPNSVAAPASVVEEKIVKHTLIGDVEDKTPLQETSNHQNIIPTTEVIRNIDVVYENGIDTKVEEVVVDHDEFIITPVTTDDFVEKKNHAQEVDNEEQITLTFDLPIDSMKSMEDTSDEVMTFQLNDEVKEIKVNEHTEVIAREISETIEKRYVLEEEDEISVNDTRKDNSIEVKDEIVFEKKVISVEKSEVEEIGNETIDPIHSPISEMLKARTNERKRTMKEFNYKFNKSKIDDIEKEPAYKRQGVDLEEVPHSSESNASRLSVSTDDNDETQLRKGNSFLHDNVD
jgi:cell division protein FtsZ